MAKAVLGKKYRDKITGYEGTAITRAEYLSKCVHVELQRGSTDPTKLGKPESEWFDEERVEAVRGERFTDKAKKRSPGSPPPPMH